MAFHFRATIARGASGANPSQLVQLSDSFPILGNEWDLNVVTGLINSVTGLGIESTGTQQAMSALHQLTMQRLMSTSLRMLALTNGRGLFLFTLKPKSLLNRRWNQRQYLLLPRQPRDLMSGCLEQMAEARMNQRKPLEALARTIIAIGQLGPGGQINACLEMST